MNTKDILHAFSLPVVNSYINYGVSGNRDTSVVDTESFWNYAYPGPQNAPNFRNKGFCACCGASWALTEEAFNASQANLGILVGLNFKEIKPIPNTVVEEFKLSENDTLFVRIRL